MVSFSWNDRSCLWRSTTVVRAAYCARKRKRLGSVVWSDCIWPDMGAVWVRDGTIWCGELCGGAVYCAEWLSSLLFVNIWMDCVYTASTRMRVHLLQNDVTTTICTWCFQSLFAKGRCIFCDQNFTEGNIFDLSIIEWSDYRLLISLAIDMQS